MKPILSTSMSVLLLTSAFCALASSARADDGGSAYIEVGSIMSNDKIQPGAKLIIANKEASKLMGVLPASETVMDGYAKRIGAPLNSEHERWLSISSPSLTLSLGCNDVTEYVKEGPQTGIIKSFDPAKTVCTIMFSNGGVSQLLGDGDQFKWIPPTYKN